MPPTPSTTLRDNRRRAHRRPPTQVDVAVIGSGLGGLVAAARLAQRGLSVAVFEAHYTAGGCATQFSRGPKSARWRFDVGLHYIGDCANGGTIPRILDELGIRVDFAELDQDGFDTLVFPDLRFRIPADLDQYRDRLVALFPHETRGIDGYVKLVRAVMNVSRVLEETDGRRASPWELARIALDGVRLARWQSTTIAEVLAHYVRDPKVAAIILGQSGDYGLPPSKASALLHLGLAGHYFRGAYYPKGGGQVIADRLAARIEELGGSIHLRTPVEKIVVEGGRIVGVRLASKAGEPALVVKARAVLSNADLKRTITELVGAEHVSRETVQRAEKWEMAAAIFMTAIGLEGDGRDLGMAATNVWQFDHYDVERVYRADRGEGPIGIGACYITSASIKDPTNALHHAPSGYTGVEVMAIVPASPSRWAAEGDAGAWSYKHGDVYLARKHALEDELVERLDLLFPGAKARIVFRESASPMTQRRFTGATDGTAYGLAGTPAQFMKGRPGYRGPIPGLYFTGASTRAGHGIVGAMMGGRAAALRLARELPG